MWVFPPGETPDEREVCLPRARLYMHGKCVYPGRDYRCAEDECSPEETIYCVYWIIIV